eukprot:2489285-Rhodomonas_salina.1
MSGSGPAHDQTPWAQSSLFLDSVSLSVLFGPPSLCVLILDSSSFYLSGVQREMGIKRLAGHIIVASRGRISEGRERAAGAGAGGAGGSHARSGNSNPLVRSDLRELFIRCQRCEFLRASFVRNKAPAFFSHSLAWPLSLLSLPPLVNEDVCEGDKG